MSTSAASRGWGPGRNNLGTPPLSTLTKYSCISGSFVCSLFGLAWDH
jgi:hypothetical protein